MYPVCSRRAGGISIGINLNLDKTCTFNCVYCQVDRTAMPVSASRQVDLNALRAELADMLSSAAAGRLLAEPEFASLPAHLKRLNDVAFSGDGEPTCSPAFAEAVALAERQIVAAGLDLKLVLITNATLLDRPAVGSALELLHGRRGEVWAKLDAGTEEFFRLIDRGSVPFERVLRNIRQTASRWPIVIQSCFMQLDGQPPPAEQIEAYCDRLGEILAEGTIRLVQVYTVARPPAESFVVPLSRQQVDSIVAAVRRRHPHLPAAAYYA